VDDAAPLLVSQLVEFGGKTGSANRRSAMADREVNLPAERPFIDGFIRVERCRHHRYDAAKLHSEPHAELGNELDHVLLLQSGRQASGQSQSGSRKKSFKLKRDVY
jgi:hypothetical protein